MDDFPLILEPLTAVPATSAAAHELARGAAGVPAWQRELARAVTRPEELLELLQLDPALPGLNYAQAKQFPLRVPRGFVARMRRGDPRDPLFLQVWPSTAELLEVPGYSFDAVGDLERLKDGGIIHKYQGRALLITTGACGVHCRYCFRRHFPYSEALASRNHWQAALAQLAADPSINEVILSGGDPLSLSDDKLATLAEGLTKIPHIRRLRIHTRQPVVLPERVDASLLGWLQTIPLQKVMVVHINHPNEVDERVREALLELRKCGITLLNQSVLLNGINDTPQVLGELSDTLFASGVLPYYLHILDRTHGTAHFDVDEPTAQSLLQALNAKLPGFLVPRLVRERAGAPGKVPIAW